MNNQYTVYDIANWFLKKQRMSPKKLQKMCYYAEAWSNALFHTSLMNDTEFEAWAHGPVSPQLYSKYRSYGWNDIVDYEEVTIDNPKIEDLLESVFVTYGEKSANELEALTHQEQPWKVARLRGNVSEGESCNEVVSKTDMKNFYSSIYIGD